MKRFYSVFFIAALLLVVTGLTEAQTAKMWRIRLIGTNGTGVVDTTFIGTAEGATNCIDSTNLKEEELPPPPPAGVFDVRVIGNNAAERTDVCLGQGLNQSFRKGSTTTTLTDTFLVKFQPASEATNVVFTWAPLGKLGNGSAASLADMVESASLLVSGGTPVNLLTATDFTVTPDDDPYPTQFRIFVTWKSVITNVSQQSTVVPQTFGLAQNYPNPFNPTTSMSFDIKENAMTEISVFNVLGQKVATLVNQQMNPGTFVATWNGTDDMGMSASSGVYFVRMNASYGSGENFTQMRKIVLMK